MFLICIYIFLNAHVFCYSYPMFLFSIYFSIIIIWLYHYFQHVGTAHAILQSAGYLRWDRETSAWLARLLAHNGFSAMIGVLVCFWTLLKWLISWTRMLLAGFWDTSASRNQHFITSKNHQKKQHMQMQQWNLLLLFFWGAFWCIGDIPGASSSFQRHRHQKLRHDLEQKQILDRGRRVPSRRIS